MSAGGNQKNRRGKLRFFRFVPQLSAEAVDASSGPHQNEAAPHHNFELIPLVSTLLLHMTMRKHELRAPSGEQGRPPRLSTVLIQQLLSVSSTLHEPDSWSGSTSVVECKAPLQQ